MIRLNTKYILLSPLYRLLDQLVPLHSCSDLLALVMDFHQIHYVSMDKKEFIVSILASGKYLLRKVELTG
jgi:hypothetical protein